MSSVIVIPAMFVITASLLLWFVIYAKGHSLAKAVCIALTLGSSCVIANSLNDIQGWATKEPLPEKFEVLWANVRQPIKDDNGAIYVWTIDLKGNEPRSYKLPYTREMHEKAEAVKKQVKSGQRVMGMKGKGKKGDGKGKGEGNGKGTKDQEGKGGGGMTKNADEFDLYEFPPAQLPQKETE